ncbi:MAG: response regulator [Desulfobulbaceae bacterium]|nr:response regulator [Desulfobulbaceae bacterium]HIJ77901.1 response regulator [Deltaproteobacteria bacterium]
MQPAKPRHDYLSGLRKKFFFWFLTLSLIPLSLVSTISYLSSKDTLIVDATKHLSAAMELKKEFIEAFFAERISDLELQAQLATNTDLLSKLITLHNSLALTGKNFVQHPRWQALTDPFQADIQKFTSLYGYHDFLLLDPAGNILYSVMAGDDLGRNIFSGQFAGNLFSHACRQALQSGEIIFSDLEHFDSSGDELDSFIVKTIKDKHGKTLGLIALQIPMEQIDQLMQNRVGMGRTGETFLIGNDLIMRSDSWKENGGTALKTRVETDLVNSWLHQHGSVESDTKDHSHHAAIQYPNHRGIKVFGVIEELTTLEKFDIHWAVVAEVTAEETLALVNRLRLITILLLAGTAICVGLASIFIAGGIVAPIKDLTQWARLIAEGNLTPKEGAILDNEIGELQSSFQQMVISVQGITEVCESIAIGDFTKPIPIRGENDSLGQAVTQMQKNLREVVRQAEAIAQGDFSVQITPWSADDQLGAALLQMTIQLRDMEKTNRESLANANRLTEHLDNLPTPVLSVNKNFRINYINNAGAGLAGMAQNECIGKYCYNLFPNGHCRTKECRVAMAMRNKSIETAETMIYQDGYNLPIRYTGSPVFNEKDEVVGALEYLIDISETKTALQAIETESWIQAGVALVNDRLRGEQQLAKLCHNLLSALAQRLDIPMAAIYVAEEDSLNLLASYSSSANNTHRERFAAGEGIIGQVAREKQLLVIDEIPKESIRLVSGMLEAAPRQLVALPLIFEEQIKGVIELGAFNPLNEKKFAFLERIASHIAIAINSSQSRAKLTTLLKKTQQQAMELQNQQEELRVTNEELEAQTQSLKEREAQLQSQHEELMVVNEELEEKTNSLEEQRHDIEKKNQDLEHARLDLERKAEELTLASKYKSEFLANMSHELRTPLNSLLLLSNNLAQNKDGNLNEDQVESAEIMYNSGNDLLELINEILDLSKIEAGRVELNVADLALTELADHLRDNFQPLSTDKGLKFSINIDPQAPATIRTDRQRLEQVLRNLISNAVKFTDQGKVTVAIRPLTAAEQLPPGNPAIGSTLVVAISDTGIGIPAEKQKIIFEAFHQVDGSTSRKYGGTGLGLSISKNLITLLEGELTLVSTPNQGSTFTLYLPYAVTAAKSSGPAAAASPAKPASPPLAVRRPMPQAAIADDRDNIGEGDKTLLIIEDDPNFAKTLVKQGHEKGFKCLASPNGHNGLILAEQFRPSAVILDINLPDLTGWEVLDALKKNPTLRHIPVHMMSVEEKTLDAYKKGAVGYLHKPVSQKDLHAAFDRLEHVIAKEIRELLVVEDDMILRREIVKLVGNGDVKTTALATGAEVIQALKASRFDCMILDIGLPDMSGFELLDRLEHEQDVEIPPVIIYTGRELTREEHESLYHYTDSIIIKGVKSVERLLDETSLFLHRAVDRLPADSRKMIANLYEQDAMFADKKLLVVDDDMRNAFALSKILSDKKMEILIANNGVKALEMLAEHQDIDLVLMDIMMPEMDGYETMAKIRSQEKFWNLPIIALTAKAMPEDKAKCLAAGANDYLAKPVEEARLLSMMRIWLYR